MKALLQHAAREIRSLRRENEILSAKAEVFEVFALALRGIRPKTGLYSQDIAGFLEEAAEKLETSGTDHDPDVDAAHGDIPHVPV